MRLISLTGELLEDTVYIEHEGIALKLDAKLFKTLQSHSVALRLDRLNMTIEQPHYAQLVTIHEFNVKLA